MIVAQKVQEAMQGEDAQFGELRVARRARLTASDAAGDDDVSEKNNRDSGFGIRDSGFRIWDSGFGARDSRFGIRRAGETQHISRAIDAAVRAVERADG